MAHDAMRLGMVGGGRGSQIGDTHRFAARLDGHFELVGGAFDIDPALGRALAHDLGLDPARAYANADALIAGERGRDDAMRLVAVATPNASHFAIAHALLSAGFDVVCEKPLTTTLADALALADLARRNNRVCAVMYGYSGFPLVRRARAMVAAGALGRIRVVQAEFAHGGLASAVEHDVPRLRWRMDPQVAGPSYSLADAGGHAAHLACFVSGQGIDRISADFTSFVRGRRLEDNAQLMLRFDGGARGALWSSAVAVGQAHGLNIRVFGELGGLAWAQENANQLLFTPLGEATRIIQRAADDDPALARRGSRNIAGHAEGFIEAMANIYCDVAETLRARDQGRAPDPLSQHYPDVMDGVRGVKYIHAAVASAAADGRWVDAGLDRPQETAP